jgi:hypothetical protein
LVVVMDTSSEGFAADRDSYDLKIDFIAGYTRR